jgi:hypothetical protein
LRIPIVPIAATLVAANLALAAFAQSSASFEMKRVSATAAGSTASSAGFESTVLIGQESPTGAASACNTGFLSSFGFWSVLGDLSVPIRLNVKRAAGDPQAVELTWTGADAEFNVFRSQTPNDVHDPTNLTLVTSECAAGDPRAGEADLVFYNVVANAGE